MTRFLSEANLESNVGSFQVFIVEFDFVCIDRRSRFALQLLEHYVALVTVLSVSNTLSSNSEFSIDRI
jgi:hypothetical protein